MPTSQLNAMNGDPRRKDLSDLENQQSDGDTPRHSNDQYHGFGAGLVNKLRVKDGEVYEGHTDNHPRWYKRLLDSGFEENGIKPVPLELRTSRQYNNLFTVFFTCLLCLLPIPTGMLATLEFKMSLRDSFLVILGFGLITCIPPAYMGIGGMETGMRQMVQARYSFGRYLVTIPLLLNAATLTGFSLSSAVVGGQTIATLDPSRVSVNIGIVITCLVSFAVSLFGFRTVHFWERWTWIPNLIAIVIAVGCGGAQLRFRVQDLPPATPQQVLSYGGIIAGYFITFGGTVSDYSIYHNPTGVSKLKIFAYIYFSLLLPSVPLLTLGAAIGASVPLNPAWAEAYHATGVGGVMRQMLAYPGTAPEFQSFVLVFLALSVIGNIAVSMYSVSLNLQMLVSFFTRVPRFVFIVITMAVMIPMAMQAAVEWEKSMINFLSVIGYWAGCFDAVLIAEYLVFRGGDYMGRYDLTQWNVARLLPPGFAAMGASLVSLALVVPGMAQSWYTGPLAKVTGDIGFEMAFVVTALFYVPFRFLEIKFRGGRV